ncbi:TipAS antibiotic-recognition domain-containing protein [Planomonospora sp. ID82291]|nr:TipAS antibiotic-recognition domain-containing protein [Planomonospora sp. ID82291]
MDEQYADLCRRSLAEEQERSLSATGGWAHVDKDQVHKDWHDLYSELASRLEGAQPADDRIQSFIERHFAIASRFYVPTRNAYIGMALLYSEDSAMKEFHNSYHPEMVDFLGDAMYAYAQKRI